MKWQNVKLIFSRELRDQLRDRRTLMTVIMMPVLLYPLMGMAMLQVGQFMREHPAKVWLVGTDNLPEHPALIVDGKLNPQLVDEGDANLLSTTIEDDDVELQELIQKFWGPDKAQTGAELVDQLMHEEMRKRNVDLAVFFAPANLNVSDQERGPPETALDPDSKFSIDARPTVFIFHNSANDKSRIGVERMNRTLGNWQAVLIGEVLTKNEVPLKLIDGLNVTHADVAKKNRKRAALWSKILPFIIVIWSLTGAFYPAIDLCAGEKERGTFETLLSSPAARSEIAIGKLLTVMSFSMVTSLLNLLSMGFTGVFVISKLGGGVPGGGMPVGFPPIESFLWLVLALIPIAALFSAIALAAAAFARSSKEGQYYLVPLMMISMPLMMVPMLPAAQLDLGTALIPVSGLMLLLRGLIEGQYAECLRYVAPVCAVTLTCCWISVRWVIYQFNCETVLFRASERFNLSNWFQHVMREREQLPTIGAAVLCGLFILVAKFFIGMVAQPQESFAGFAQQTMIVLVATIGMPAVIMAMVLTRNARKSLRLNWCSPAAACAAVLAALFLSPLFTWISALVLHVYPPSGNMLLLEQMVSTILGDAPGLWAILLLFAVAPALIEETAFRGFILSGLEGMRSKWQAIFICSLLFGLAHAVIQQSIITFFVGMLLGIIAVQTKSLIPCILYHAVHNSVAVVLSQLRAPVIESNPLLSQILVTSDGKSFEFGIVPGVLMTIVGLAMVVWFLTLPTENGEPQPTMLKEPLPAV